jgi:hypothetical protein
MKMIMIMLSLIAQPSFALTSTTKVAGGTTTVQSGQTKDCQIADGPGVTMFGLCYKEGDVVIFKSCADFTCRVDNSVLVEPLEDTHSGCFKDKDPAQFKLNALKEHKVSKLSEINRCRYGVK